MIINLTKGFESIVDPEDFEWASAFSWVYAGNGRGTHYAGRWLYSQGKRKQVRLHREIAARMFGDNSTKMEVDHINRDGLDNRRSNLRLATRSQNLKNRRAHTPSGMKGVYWVEHCKKWEASLTRAGKKYYFGLFELKADAQQEVARQWGKYENKT